MDDSQKQPRKKWQRRSFKVTPPASDTQKNTQAQRELYQVGIGMSVGLIIAAGLIYIDSKEEEEDAYSEEGSSAPVWVYNPILHHMSPAEKVSTPMRASEPPVWYVQGGYHSRHSQLYVKSATAGKRSSAVRGGFSLFSKGAGS